MDVNKIKSNDLIIKILLFISIFAIIIMRRPDIITHAQPWAEDGTIWLQDIYNNGLFDSIIRPQNGYYQTIAKLIYSISLIFGVENAPLVANILSTLIRVFFVFFVISKRFSYIDIKFRAAFICYFLLMPNISEGYVNATNAQWYLAIYMIAYLIAEKPVSKSWKIHDFILIVISSLSGPFVVFLSLPYLIKRINENGGIINTFKSINANDLAFSVCFIIQFAAILYSQSETRSAAPLGAGLLLFCDIFYYKLIAGLLSDNTQVIGSKSVLHVFVTAIYFVVIAFLAFKKSWRYSVVLLSILLIIGFGLAKPMMSLDKPQWDFFLLPVGDRYFLIPQLGVFCAFLALISITGVIKDITLFAFTALCLIFCIKSFSIPELPNVNYREQAEQFNQIDSGEKFVINSFPPGWTVTLIKK
ncbi:MAG: glucosyl transferase [Enterobacteriaceae bacterium]|nr:glucosyl transferase [Enterobacteriaceae bacterium]